MVAYFYRHYHQTVKKNTEAIIKFMKYYSFNICCKLTLINYDMRRETDSINIFLKLMCSNVKDVKCKDKNVL